MEMLFLGDSLVEYFDWQKRFPEQNITNLGVSGESVQGLLSRIEEIIKEYPSAEAVFLMTGINNIAMEDVDFFDAYREIIGRLRTSLPEAAIYVHSILPALVFFISNDVIQRVNTALRELVEDSGARYIDVNSLFLDTGGRAVMEYFLDDGVHLSDSGYAVWSGALEDIINTLRV